MPDGTLFLVPTPIGKDKNAMLELSALAVQVILDTRHFIVEDIRSARRLIASLSGHKPIDELLFAAMGKHDDQNESIAFLQYAKNGHNIVLLSEAGSPCVADPGSVIVAAAHAMSLNIKPLSGPSSIIQALMASGFNGQQFTFWGYLPIASGAKKEAILKIERQMLATGQTQIFIETPFRNQQLMEALVSTCQPSTKLCVAAGIGTDEERIENKTIEKWKHSKLSFAKIPAVFLLGKGSRVV